ncbi:MAG TPA: tail fiber domain-containing protein [Verrucomicrobiae bacterium]
MKNTIRTLALALLALVTLNSQLSTARAQGTAFTYQGELNSSGSPVSGSYDLTFALFSVSSGAGQVGNSVTNSAVLVSNGLFTTTLDFGTNFPGADRWLEIGVRSSGGGSFATLSPRQKFTPTPYAIFANTASNLSGAVPLAELPPAVAQLNNSGINNFFAGGNAGNTAVTGQGNSGIGADALTSLTSGSDNAANGFGALQNTSSGSDNTADGYEALFSNTSGSYNVADGYKTLFSNTNGNDNSAVGYEALFSNTFGIQNTANGELALYSNTTGDYNTANGSEVLYANTSGHDNTGNGYQALYQNTTGYGNTADGSGALVFNNGGYFNTADGDVALENNTFGDYNTANGYEALTDNTSGDNNTADGAAALLNLSGGSYNIALGQNAGTAIVNGNNNIDIGNSGFGDESSTIRIGTAQTKAVMAGIYGATIASGGTAVYVNSSGLLGTITSSRRFKQNIHSMASASDVLLALRPVTFQYKKDLDPAGTPQFGLVAEEVEKVDPALVVHDDKHQVYSVRYEAVNAMLLNEFLKQHGTVEEQSSEIKTLQKQNSLLTGRLDDLEAAIKSLGGKK